MDLTAAEIRVLGCLLEKQRTTPDAYPLSLNALRLACNQSTNRDPVVDFDDHTVREALDRLGRRRWTRLTSGAGSRARRRSCTPGGRSSARARAPSQSGVGRMSSKAATAMARKA